MSFINLYQTEPSTSPPAGVTAAHQVSPLMLGASVLGLYYGVPETDHVVIAGVRVARGSRVTMLPGARRADAQDLFLTGRKATVQAVFHDVDGNVHVAVSPDRDDLADLQSSHGRYLYFSIDELNPNPSSSQEVPEHQEDLP